MSKKIHNTKDDLKTKYELPQITQNIECPSCDDGFIKITRTLHKLPDGEEILILLMECTKCNFQQNDVLTLNTSVGPGTYTLKVNDGDLSHKIFRSPTGYIYIPEADFEIEPGSSSGYLVTFVEGIITRMLHWAEFMKKSSLESGELVNEKINTSIGILKKILAGNQPFTLILKDLSGGSYISTDKKDVLTFEPYIPDSNA